MATIDINQYIEQSGMRKARFGGSEPVSYTHLTLPTILQV